MMQLRTWPKYAPVSILKSSEKLHVWDRCETLPFFPRFLVSESTLWKFCATSVQTTVSYKILMSSENCIYVVMYMDLNMQCLRHTNWTAVEAKECQTVTECIILTTNCEDWCVYLPLFSLPLCSLVTLIVRERYQAIFFTEV